MPGLAAKWCIGKIYTTMLIRVLPCATQFINHLDQALRQSPQAQRLTQRQRYFLAFVISAMILTQKLCWATMNRGSLGLYSSTALWWMFYRSEIVWHLLLRFSVLVIIDRYDLSEGNLLIDDAGRTRCKRTKKIGKTHKIREKKTSGYVNGQELVFLVLQTPLVTVPVDFRFYMPDPKMTEWRKNRDALKKQGVPPKDRPPKPKPNKEFPTKHLLALDMIQAFQ